MFDFEAAIFTLAIASQLLILALVIFSTRKSLWASRFALKAKNASQKASVMTTRQIEILANVYRKTGLNWGDLPPTRGWAASPDFLDLVYETIVKIRPAVVVEFGSGVSTIVAAAALKNIDHGQLYTFDHDESFLYQTKRNLARLKLDDVVVAKHAPLVQYCEHSRKYSWYGLGNDDLPRSIDLLVVDGPPEPIVGEGGRAPVIKTVHGRLTKNSYVLFDDAARPGEQKMIEEILSDYPEWQKTYCPTEKGAIILTHREGPR